MKCKSIAEKEYLSIMLSQQDLPLSTSFKKILYCTSATSKLFHSCFHILRSGKWLAEFHWADSLNLMFFVKTNIFLLLYIALTWNIELGVGMITIYLKTFLFSPLIIKEKKMQEVCTSSHWFIIVWLFSFCRLIANLFSILFVQNILP